jgi:tetratricopeptide (TPR) repeat protein
MKWIKRILKIGILLLVLSFPRFWRATPPGIEPVVRVNAKNLMGAWALKRTARQALAAGQTDKALLAWQSALMRNSADTEALRGLLGTLEQMEVDQKQRRAGLSSSFWLLKITGTNQADAELVAQFLNHYEEYDWVLQLTQKPGPELSPGMQTARCIALFQSGRIEAFAQEYNATRPQSSKNSELRLVHAAYLMGWGPLDTVNRGRVDLEQAQSNPPERVLATRLLLLVYQQRTDVAQCARLLNLLGEWRLDRPLDHCRYWEALLATGQKKEAAKLARDYPRTPSSLREVISLTAFYLRLDLKDEALQTFNFCLDKYEDSPNFWLAYTDFMVQGQQWDDLITATLRMRQCKGLAGAMDGYSLFLEGQALSALGRTSDAEAAYARAAKFTHHFSELDLRVAMGLLKQNQAALACPLLAQLEPRMSQQGVYWQTVFIAACLVKSPDLMLKSAEAAYRLRPKDPINNLNYAAALITLRQKPEEAVKLTFYALAQFPNLAATKINHALALLLNQRISEAEDLLKTVPDQNLAPQEITALQMAWCEVYLNQKHFDKVLDTAAKIDKSKLFPTELAWLQKAHATAQSAISSAK